MSRDFGEVAHDVIAGVGLLQRGAPEAMKAFVALSTAATASRAIDTKRRSLWRSRSASQSTAMGADPLRAYDQFAATKP